MAQLWGRVKHCQVLIAWLPAAMLSLTIVTLLLITVSVILHPEWLVMLLVKALKVVPLYMDYVMRRISLQVGHEAWGLLAGRQNVGVAPEIVKDDAQLPIEKVAFEFPPDESCPPNVQQVAVAAFLCWLVKLALPAGNGGVGM